MLLSLHVDNSASIDSEEYNRKKNSIFKSHDSISIKKGGSKSKGGGGQTKTSSSKKASKSSGSGSRSKSKSSSKGSGSKSKKASKGKSSTKSKKASKGKSTKGGSKSKKTSKGKSTKGGSKSKKGAKGSTKSKKGAKSSGSGKGGSKSKSSSKGSGVSTGGLSTNHNSLSDMAKIRAELGIVKQEEGVTNHDHREKMKKVEYEKFEFGASVIEPYRANEYTSSGGVFSDSQALKYCHQRKISTGQCVPPCYDQVPGDPTGRCFVYSKDRECLCIDPCTLYSGKELDPVTGSTLKGSGDPCERCVRHKSWRFFLEIGAAPKQPSRINPRSRPNWVYDYDSNKKSRRKKLGPSGKEIFDVSCGMCDSECVAGTTIGPKIDGDECPGVWNWKIDQCRRMELTSEESVAQEEGALAGAAAGDKKEGEGFEFETYREDKPNFSLDDKAKDDKAKGEAGKEEKKPKVESKV